MTPTRPRSVAEMIRRNENFVTEDSYRRGVNYRPNPSDIFISPYSKCGTTWMQQIVHGLRSDGSMEFAEITEVVPWLELAHDMGWDVNATQVATPRAFKSHLRWDEIPKGGRYIVVLRDPVDAMVSLFNFLNGWHFEAGSVSIAGFADYYLNRPNQQGYWGHAASWWRERARPEILLLGFEHMKRDLPGAVERVANFMGIGDDVGLRALATRQAEFDFMKRHGRQFDDHLLRAARDAACGLPPGGEANKVSTGQVGGGAPLITDEIRDAFAQRWRASMTTEFGLGSYSDILNELR